MILLAPLLIFTLAALLGWLAGNRWSLRRLPFMLSTLSWSLCALGSVGMVVAGGIALSRPTGQLNLSLPSFLDASTFRLDAVSALFLVIIFAVAVPAILAAISSTQRHSVVSHYRLASAIAVVLLTVAVIVTTNNFFVFLASWEGLGFAFYLIVGYDRELPDRATASILTVTFSKVSGAALLIGGLLLAAQSGGLALSQFSHVPPGITRDAAYTLLFIGFAVKVGAVPLHLWIPRSYAAAPPAARAVLAGVAVNVGFYGLLRTLGLLGAPPVWLVCAVLIIAGITAVLGIAHASVHADLRYLIAWSSVENAGIILAGFGVALVGQVVGSVPLTAAGLVAALAQVVAHALAKSLLFVSTASIETAYGTTDLDQLRGIARRLPVSGTGLVVGAMTLAGVPLTAGFASEWLILQSLMQQFRVHELALNLSLAAAGILVALTIGIASITFVRLIAFTAFSRPRDAVAREPLNGGDRRERSWTFRIAVGLLVLGCLGAAAAAPLEIQLIAQGLVPVVADAAFSAVTDGLTLQPVFPGFSALSPTLLWIVIPAFSILLALLAIALSRGRFLRVRRVAAWSSGSPGVRGGYGYTSFGFVNAVRTVFSALLVTRSTGKQPMLPVSASSLTPGSSSRRFSYVIEVHDVIELYVYRPILPIARAIVHQVKRLQSGRLDAYMAYMLVAVLAILAVVTALAN